VATVRSQRLTAAVSGGHRIITFDRVGSDREVCRGAVVGVGEVADRGVCGARVPARLIGKELGRAHSAVRSNLRAMLQPMLEIECAW
jgi:hypothetical protein